MEKKDKRWELFKVTVDGTEYKNQHSYLKSIYSDCSKGELYSKLFFHLEAAFPKFEWIPLYKKMEVDAECKRLQYLIDGSTIHTARNSQDHERGTFHIVLRYKS